MNNVQSEKEIREGMKKWAEALSEKDLETMHKIMLKTIAFMML